MPDYSSAQVLNFWFGTTAQDTEQAQRRWFAATHADDHEIKVRFGGALTAAATGELDSWTQTAQGRLAFIIVCDQFPRNIHRGTAQAFATDPLALREAKLALQTRETHAFPPKQRSFALMPFEHSENQEDQATCVAQFEQLLAEAPQNMRSQCTTWLEHARNHQALIEQFGRFPSRNAALGRTSTAAEIEWLADGGEGFGGQSVTEDTPT